MKIKDRESSEQYDICEFCYDMWGVDQRRTCRTPCTCAAYANQDYVPQIELPIGLPVSRPWDPTLVPKGAPIFWENLSEIGRKHIMDNMAGILQSCDEALGRMLIMLFQGATKAEICKELRIDDQTYYVYAERLRESSRDYLNSL
mgnify:CR=1 FL=1